MQYMRNSEIHLAIQKTELEAEIQRTDTLLIDAIMKNVFVIKVIKEYINQQYAFLTIFWLLGKVSVS